LRSGRRGEGGAGRGLLAHLVCATPALVTRPDEVAQTRAMLILELVINV
jgi:hypothetical protein